MITATTFSFISLSLSSLLTQWKETRKYRVAKREMKERRKLLGTMSSKDLLQAAKLKDQERLNEALKKEFDEENNVNA